MTAPINASVLALAEELQTMSRKLEKSREQWDDEARRAFDRQHIDHIVTGGGQAIRDLQEIAAQAARAMRALEDAS